MMKFVLGRWSWESKIFATYVKVEVYNEERENNPMLCFSSTDPIYMINRGQMSKKGVNRMNSFKKKAILISVISVLFNCPMPNC